MSQMLLKNIMDKFSTTLNKKEFKRGEIIYHDGDSPSGIYLIEKGLVGLFHISESGKESFLRVFGDNSILGHRSYLAKTFYHASAIALNKTTVFYLNHSQSESILENREILRFLSETLSKDLGNVELRLSGLQDKSAHKRIVESLIYLKSKYPHHIWTRKEIADYAGSSFETVARVLSLLETKNLIKKNGRDFTILNCQKLLTLSSEDLKI